MSDWPGVKQQLSHISIFDPKSGAFGGFMATMRATTAALVWPAANRAIYLPFEIQQACTAYQIGLEVTTQSGNLDVGIYDELGTRLVSAGSTGVAVAGVQVVNVADTALNTGCYFLAMCVDNTTAAFRRSNSGATEAMRVMGMQQQAVGAVTLPNPATFANPASLYAPVMFLSTMQSTI